MISIVTRFHSASSSRGARLSARSSDGGVRVFISYPHDASGDDAHWQAALAYIQRQRWSEQHREWSVAYALDGARVFSSLLSPSKTYVVK